MGKLPDYCGGLDLLGSLFVLLLWSYTLLLALFNFTALLVFQTGRFPVFDFHLACQVVGSAEGDENKGSKNNSTNLARSDGGRFPGNRLYFGHELAVRDNLIGLYHSTASMFYRFHGK